MFRAFPLRELARLAEWLSHNVLTPVSQTDDCGSALKNTVYPHLPARVWPVGAGACEVYGSDRLHPSTVQGCVMVVRHARRQFRGQSSLRVSPVQQSCWQPTEQQSAEGAKPACCIAPPPCVACPPAILAPVGRLRSRAHAGKRCSAHSRANTVPSPLPVCIQARGAR